MASSEKEKTPQPDPKKPARDFNDEVIKDDWWLKLTRIFHKLIGKS